MQEVLELLLPLSTFKDHCRNCEELIKNVLIQFKKKATSNQNCLLFGRAYAGKKVDKKSTWGRLRKAAVRTEKWGSQDPYWQIPRARAATAGISSGCDQGELCLPAQALGNNSWPHLPTLMLKLGFTSLVGRRNRQQGCILLAED